MNTKNAAYAEELKQVNNKRKKVKDQLKQEEKKVSQSYFPVIGNFMGVHFYFLTYTTYV